MAEGAQGELSQGGVWRNWSGALSCAPARIVRPADEAELAAAVGQAVGPVRAAGTGHSFTPIVITDGTLIDMDAITGVVAADASTGKARVRGGSKISDIGKPLLDAGLALENQGDINRQSITGAVSTGTHGTGIEFGSISTQVAGFRLVKADGEILSCDRDNNTEIFEAGRVSLGTLGVLSELTLQCTRAFVLEEMGGRMAVSDVMAHIDELRDANRHFEFFWFPFADEVLVKFLNTTDKEARPPRVQTGPSSDHRVMVAACEAARFLPFLRGRLQRFLTNASGSRYALDDGEGTQRSKVRHAYQAFPSDRNVRFNEMEYAVPAEAGPECVQAVARHMREAGGNFLFPIEYRYVKGDDIWLSPFYGRDSVTISIHQYHKQSYRRLFDGCEAIMRHYGGRPHWGKLHTLTARELAELYPRWDDFCALRKRLDPDGKFLTPYLARIFGEA